MREEQVSKKESKLDGLGNSQPLWTSRDGQMRGFTIQKSDARVCMACAEKTECVTQGCPQPFEQKLRTEMRTQEKAEQETRLYPCDRHRVFENVMSAETWPA